MLCSGSLLLRPFCLIASRYACASSSVSVRLKEAVAAAVAVTEAVMPALWVVSPPILVASPLPLDLFAVVSTPAPLPMVASRLMVVVMVNIGGLLLGTSLTRACTRPPPPTVLVSERPSPSVFLSERSAFTPTPVPAASDTKPRLPLVVVSRPFSIVCASGGPLISPTLRVTPYAALAWPPPSLRPPVSEWLSNFVPFWVECSWVAV